MSSDVVFTAVQNFLIANFTSAPLVFENDPPFMPEPPSLWVFVEVYDISFDQVSMGSGSPLTALWREEGAVICNVMAPTGTGTYAARVMATSLAHLFVGLEISPGIRFQRVSIASATESWDGNYWPISMRSEWWREDAAP